MFTGMIKRNLEGKTALCAAAKTTATTRRAFVSKIVPGLLIACAAVQMFGTPALAQAYPEKTVKIIVGFPPGGGTDAIARFLSQELTSRSGKSFIVENVPGATGAIGAGTVARAPADGYTLLFTGSEGVLVQPLRIKDLGFTADSFAPVIPTSEISQVVTVSPSLNVNTLKELVDLAKSKPEGLKLGSAGIGSFPHLNGERLKLATGINLNHIPYKGGADAMKALLGGEIDLYIPSVSEAGAQIKAGGVMALTVLSADRVAALPDVPTSGEAGYPEFLSASHHWLLAPAGTPPETVDWLNKSVNEILKGDAAIKLFTSRGLAIAGGSAADFASSVSVQATNTKEFLESVGLVSN